MSLARRVLSHLALLRVQMQGEESSFFYSSPSLFTAQVEAAQGEMEGALIEDIVEYLDVRIQENLPDFEDSIDILQGRMHQLVDNFCETLLWKSKDEVCSDLTELESTCSADVADAVDAQVNNNSGVPRNLDSLRAQIHSRVDYFCDMMGDQPEKAQMEAALAEMEEALMRDILEFVEDSIQENLPESSPLLCETQQEFRRRVCEPSGSYSPPSGSYSPPGPNQPFDSSTSRSWYDWILERFYYFNFF
ncbi:uncharacterized protein ACBT57_016998 isoform 1-T1 [Dama dama]|uniref:uncharacterized protein LOC133063376 isoform X1 n=2 Tax=Dama dama TaxID=30532 RepID=UPI002A362291|nr:uncharacterized protein LOC133063376 isoform X1 [Dama dama]